MPTLLGPRPIPPLFLRDPTGDTASVGSTIPLFSPPLIARGVAASGTVGITAVSVPIPTFTPDDSTLIVIALSWSAVRTLSGVSNGYQQLPIISSEFAIFYKQWATAADSGSTFVATLSTTAKWTAHVRVYAHAEIDLLGSSGQANGSGLTCAFPAVTSSAPFSTIVAFETTPNSTATNGTVGTVRQPTGFAQWSTVQSGAPAAQNTAMNSWDLYDRPAGAFTVPTVQDNDSVVHFAYVLSIAYGVAQLGWNPPAFIRPGASPLNMSRFLETPRDTSYAGVQQHFASAADTIPLADSVGRAQGTQVRGLGDSVPVADAITRGSQTENRAGADSVPLADTLARTQANFESTADSIPLADAVARAQATQSRTTADSIPVADIASTPVTFNLRQQAKWSSSTGTATSSALTTSTASLLVLTIGINSVSVVTSVTDQAGNNWQKGPSGVASSITKDAEIWYCLTGTLTGQTITVNGPANSTSVCFQEYTHSQTGTPFVDSSLAQTNTTSLTPPAANVTPTTAYDLVVCMILTGSPAATTTTLNAGPFAALTTDQTIAGGQLAAFTTNPASGTPLAATWTVSPTRLSESASIAFGLSSGGGVATASDSIPVADTVTRAQGTQARADADSIPVADVITRAPLANARATADSVPVADVAARTQGGQARTGADAVPVADSAARSQAIQARALADSVPVAETLTRTETAARALADSVPVAETAARAQGTQARTSSDLIPVADVLVSQATATRATADTVPVAAALTRTETATRGLTDSVPVADVVTRTQGTKVRATADTVPVAELVTRAQAGQARGSADSVQVAAAIGRGAQTQGRALADAVPVTEVLTRQNTFGVQLADTMPLADLAVVAAFRAFRATADTLPISDTVGTTPVTRRTPKFTARLPQF